MRYFVPRTCKNDKVSDTLKFTTCVNTTAASDACAVNP